MGSLFLVISATLLVGIALVPTAAVAVVGSAEAAVAIVTGGVFCDRCKDGRITLFDYPLAGVKVAVACHHQDVGRTVRAEETTDWFGHYTIRFAGRPELSRCMVQVVPELSSACAAGAGPAESPRLLFRWFDTVVYEANPIFSQPARPAGFCPRFGNPAHRSYASPRKPTLPPSPVQLPPEPPSLQATACPFRFWLKTQYQCYWRVVTPTTKVTWAFGLPAERRYGADMTLWEGLQGRGDLYRTLLREAIAALLNSRNTYHFRYAASFVTYQMTDALLGSPRHALLIAMRFKSANSGNGNASCNFTPCK